MIPLTFVSTNEGKYREVHELLSPLGIRTQWKRRVLPEPQAADLGPVLVAKLAAVRNVPGYVLVEDSGLFIHSLHGFPGVYSAHFYDTWGFGPMLELLRTRPRAASFRTIAGLRVGRRTWTFLGEVNGRIAPRPQGRRGFGYDPIFIPEGGSRTFGEMEGREKNLISHRARAVLAAGQKLRRLDAARRR